MPPQVPVQAPGECGACVCSPLSHAAPLQWHRWQWVAEPTDPLQGCGRPDATGTAVLGTLCAPAPWQHGDRGGRSWFCAAGEAQGCCGDIFLTFSKLPNVADNF